MQAASCELMVGASSCCDCMRAWHGHLPQARQRAWVGSHESRMGWQWQPHRSSASSAVAQGCARTYAHVRNGAQREGLPSAVGAPRCRCALRCRCAYSPAQKHCMPSVLLDALPDAHWAAAADVHHQHATARFRWAACPPSRQGGAQVRAAGLQAMRRAW